MMMLWIGIASADSLDIESSTAVLSEDTVIYVEIRGAAEIIRWEGEGGIEVTSPGNVVTALGSRAQFNASEVGTWRVALSQDEPTGWSLGISASVDGVNEGRVFSYLWRLSSGSNPLYDRFYVPVPLAGGDEPEDGAQIFKIYTEGVYGDEVLIAASRTGMSGTPGYSNVGSYDDELPVFLERPTYFPTTSFAPNTTASTVEYDLDCDQIVPGFGGVTVAFDTDGHGQPALICDLDGDGEYDLSGADDLALLGAATPAETELYWDGYGVHGEPLSSSGELTCQLALGTSPMHALIYGADVAAPGIRLFSSITDTASPGMTMWWNDAVLGSTTSTEDGTLPQTAAGLWGVFSDDIYTDGITCSDGSGASCTAHGWGSMSADDPAYSGAWVDSWTFDDGYPSGDPFPLVLADTDDDRDGDTLPSAIEDCFIGTDPDEPDTDEDSLSDSVEVGEDWNNPPNHDGDSDIDAVDPDDDNDGVDTWTEVSDTDKLGLSEDLDTDGEKNWHDTDADDDGILDGDEPNDDDNNGVPDYLEVAGSGDSGEPVDDTGTPKANPDGVFQGGVCRCSSASGAPAGMFTGLLFLVTLWRRRQR